MNDVSDKSWVGQSFHTFRLGMQNKALEIMEKVIVFPPELLIRGKITSFIFATSLVYSQQFICSN